MRSLLKTAAAGALIGAMALGVGSLALAQTAKPAQTSAGSLKRTADGHPDFSGAWTHRPISTPKTDDPRGICVGFRCGPAAEPGAQPAAAAARPAPNFPKYKPEFRTKVEQLNVEQVNFDPALRCGNPGIPRIGPPDKIVQANGELIMLYEDLNGSYWRIIPTDGRDHREDAEEGAMGDSVGHWEGDKLVIETIGFNDETWLTDNGAFHTYDMKVIEELAPDGARVDYRLTVHDPEVLEEPWVKTAKLGARPTNPLQAVPCVEKSIDQMVGIESYHPNARW